MAEPSTRLLSDDELEAAARIVSTSMLVSLADDVVGAWASRFDASRAHGAFSADGTMSGIARWFPTTLSVPGGSVPAGAVTSVAVLPTHRRQGHLRRLMEAQLRSLADEDMPVATLIAAEWPIYGRFGYGPAVDACGWEVDSSLARFHALPTGTVTLASPRELRPALEAMHDAQLRRTPGGILRNDDYWRQAAGVEAHPGSKDDLGLLRGAVWHDAQGALQGAVSYSVHDEWIRNRPSGRVDVRLLVAATPEAERELWRHLCEVDWTTTVRASVRSIDDPIQLWLTDGRAAAPVDRSDCIWVRILSVPAALGARRATVADRVVVEVLDTFGGAGGRFAVELGPDGADVATTTEAADVRLPVGSLSAAYLGGCSVARLHHAGLADRESPRGIERLAALLSSPVAPWSPTTY